MADDLSNRWGRQLVFNQPASAHRRQKEGTRSSFKDFAMVVQKDTNDEFVLGRVVCCGSDANMFASMEGSYGDTDALFNACGSYVAGDDGPCDHWTSSGYDAFQLNTNIAHPDEVRKSTRVKTVALPYHIEVSCCDEDVLLSMENRCIEELHIRCLLMKIEGRPLRCILLELMLGGNGGELSDRFLRKLGALANKHGFTIVVDECITGGRVGPTMLLTQSKPPIFQKAVSHITMGKWPGLGIILRSKLFERNLRKPMFPRGMTTQLQTDEARYAWERVREALPSIPSRREQVLRYIKVSEDHCWGKGLVIFSERHRKDTCGGGLKNRYLPMIEQIKPATIGFTTPQPGYTKQEVAQRLQRQASAWLEFSIQQGCYPDRSFCELLSAKPPDYNFTIQEVCRELMVTKGVSTCDAKASLRHAVDNDIIDMKVRSKKRVLIGITIAFCSIKFLRDWEPMVWKPMETGSETTLEKKAQAYEGRENTSNAA